MSHKPLRTDKHCLNCGQRVQERYCSHCGQENLELNDSVIHLVIQYVRDLFNYDNRFWHTLKNLVTKPGLVAAEYMQGKRQSYLEPIRFYAFTSTIFFLIFFFALGDGELTTAIAPAENYPKRLYNLEREKSFLQGTPDTMYVVPLIHALRMRSGDTIPVVGDSSLQVVIDNGTDSIEDAQEPAGWLEKFIDEKTEAKQKELEEEFEGDQNQAGNALIKEFMHKIPQLFFLSLPFFAFILKILYWRSRRSSYVEHFVFSIYHYAFLFVIMLFYFLVVVVTDRLESPALEVVKEWLGYGLFLYPSLYLLLSMKRFYADRWGKLIFRFCVLLFLLLIVMLGLFVVVALFTYFF